MTAPKVSVIVVTYNQEDTIARTLDSVLSQQCDFHFEVIIGEDNSSDATLSICRDYAARYPEKIRLIHNNPNKGLVDNYYDCILEARGKYIADCAGDDFWIDRHKLYKQAAILDSDPEITIVHTAWQYFEEPDGKISPSGVESTHPGLLKQVSAKGELFIPILTDNHAPLIHLCTAMYRRDAFMKCYLADTRLFRDKEFLCEDLQISSSLARDGKVAYLHETTLNYSIGRPSVLSRGNPEKTFRFFLSTIKLLHYIQVRNNIASATMHPVYSRRLHYMLTQAFRLRDRKMRDDVIRWFNLTGAPRRLKTLLLMAMSANTLLWKAAVSLLKIAKQ